jgi:tRNA (guanine37-N1)-methyltransferase
MRFDIMTLFPELVETVLGTSIIGRAQKSGAVEIVAHQIRDYSEDKHRRVDDTPYGGGKGMLMAAQPIFRTYEAVLEQSATDAPVRRRVIYLTPTGQVLTQQRAKELSRDYDQLILLCGHYEGVDRRLVDEIVDEEISIGDYVLTGGEIPACILVDCVARLVPGVLADEECYEKESIASGLLEYPQYTKPAVWRGREVPAVLLSGDHAKVDAYRLETAIALTEKNRPELLEAWRIANPPPPPKKKRKKKSATVQEAVPVEISEEVLS